jgi:integrase
MGRRRTGSAILRDGVWYARITLHRDPPRHGRAPRFEERVIWPGGKTVTEARAKTYAARLQVEYDAERWAPKGAAARVVVAPLTVGAWVTSWLKTRTYTEAAKEVGRVAAWLPRTKLHGMPLADVTPRAIAAWLAELRALPTTRGGAPAPRTLRNVADPVARALRAAVFEGHLGADPFAVLPTELRPQSIDADPTARRGRRLAAAEVVTLVSEASVPWDRAVLYALLTLTGVRLAEGVGLRWCDLSDEVPLRRLTVSEQWHQRTRKRAPTKTLAVREVPVHPELDAALRWWRARWESWYGRPVTDADLIVPSRPQRAQPSAGGSRRQATVWLALRGDLAGCCLPPHRVHDLRHTFASLCVDAGMAEHIASRWTHAPSATGAREVYTRASWEAQCAEMLKLKLTTRGPWRPRLVAVAG